MNKFHAIPTDKYIPLSYDNAYLFDQYDRINNFLTFNVDKKFKHLLAKPVKANFEIEWYSTFQDLQQLEVSPDREFGLRQYWALYDELQVLLNGIARSKDENVKNWFDIIKTTFDPENNLIFTNGREISIIWGWKFENNRNQKPFLLTDSLQNTATDAGPAADSQFLPPIIPDFPMDPISEKEDDNLFEDSINVAAQEDIVIEKTGFIAFLKFFAVKYSWILVVLLTLVCLVFFFKSLKYN